MKRIRALAGEMAARIWDHSWAASPLGPIETWPQGLVTTLGILLGSRFPMQILWGPSYIHFYNDAYIPLAGDKHPAALGSPGAEVWPEVWEIVRPMLDSVRATGQATWADDMQLLLKRDGSLEEGYFTFSYGPIWGDHEVDGIFIAVTETTRRVIAERRLRSGRDLAAAIAGLRQEAEVCQRAAESLGQNPADLPFALLYLDVPSDKGLTLAGAAHLGAGHPASPAQTTLIDGPWPFVPAMAAAGSLLVDALPPAWGELPGGPWEAPASAALLVPLRTSNEAGPLGFLVAGVSPRLRLDDDYREFVERIAAQIAGRLAEARAHAAAHEEVQLRDDFLSVAAHELKNPLTPLIGRMQLAERRMRRAGVEPKHLTLIGQAVGDARRLVEQIDTLLDVSRMRGGQLSLRLARIDLAQTVRQVVEAVAPTLERHTIDLAAPPEAPVLGDAERLEQVLRNLLSNAVKYSPQGGAIAVTVTAGAGLARLAVQDSGIGIPAEAQPQLFRRYYRANNASASHTSGLGIGLFVVHEIVRLHGGRVEVQSDLGAGSTFTVLLPLAVAGQL